MPNFLHPSSVPLASFLFVISLFLCAAFCMISWDHTFTSVSYFLSTLCWILIYIVFFSYENIIFGFYSALFGHFCNLLSLIYFLSFLTLFKCNMYSYIFQWNIWNLRSHFIQLVLAYIIWFCCVCVLISFGCAVMFLEPLSLVGRGNVCNQETHKELLGSSEFYFLRYTMGTWPFMLLVYMIYYFESF